MSFYSHEMLVNTAMMKHEGFRILIAI